MKKIPNWKKQDLKEPPTKHRGKNACQFRNTIWKLISLDTYVELRILICATVIPGIRVILRYRLGWVNLYQKFEIEKYTVCGKLILPKKWKDTISTTGLRICMDLRIFASFLYPTLLKICTQKFYRKQFYSSTLNFVIICMYSKKVNLYCALRCAIFSCFENCAKIPKNSKILKNDGLFRFLTLKLV